MNDAKSRLPDYLCVQCVRINSWTKFALLVRRIHVNLNVQNNEALTNVKCDCDMLVFMFVVDC